MHSFWQILALEVGVAVLLFFITWVLSVRLNNYSLVDITWSYAFTVAALLALLLSDGYDVRRALALGMASIWSLRLGTHVLLRVSAHHPKEDPRYKILRSRWPQKTAQHFLGFFQIQAFSVAVMSVPFLLAMRSSTPHIAIVEWVGFAVWLIGVVGEATADAQAKRFKDHPANKGKLCKEGLWRYSRHPNYFFESIIWWGFWLFACGSPWGWATFYAPLMMLYFLLRVTGIPITEKVSVQNRGDAYREYQRTTSAFIPLPPRRPS